MYSNKNIPAPFNQPQHTNSRKEKPESELPSPPLPKKAAEKDVVPIISKEKTVQRKAASHNTSPLLAVLLFNILSNKEG
ncbi:hypothetical protein [Anaerotignum sp.]